MLLINNLTVDEINAALIAIQKDIDASKSGTGTTVAQQSQAEGQSENYSQQISNLKNTVAANNAQNEVQTNQINTIYNLVMQLAAQIQQNTQGQEDVEVTSPISSVNFDTETRTLTVVTTTEDVYNCIIPEGEVINENYVYDPTDRFHRLKLDINGLTAQKGTEVDGVITWEDLGTVGIDKWGNIILNNTDEKVDIGIQVTGPVYHFDDAEHLDYDEEGSNPKSITVTGERVATAPTNPILYSSESPYCVKGTVEIGNLTDLLSFVFHTKSNSIIVGDRVMYVDGTVESVVDLSSYNSAMEDTSEVDPTKTVGEYLGLDSIQIANGIFH